MASVKLRAVFFNAADNPSDMLALRYVTSLDKDPGVPGDIRRGAGGRTRAFLRAGREVKWSIGFKVLTPDQKAWLQDHMGQLVCVRDDRGGKLFGTYMNVPISERLYSHEGDTSLSITGLTYSEAV